MLNIVGRYGMFRELRSDQGTNFTADLIEGVCHALDIDQRFSIPYRPQANGKVERANQEVMRHLRAITLTRKQSSKWSLHLPLVQRIINPTPSRITGVTPSTLLYGNAIDLNRQLLHTPQPAAASVAVAEYVADLIETQQVLTTTSRDYQQGQITKYLDKSPPSPTTYPLHSYVLVSYPDRPPSKLHPKWRGPMLVVAVDGNIYDVEDIVTQEVQQVHIDRLKPYVHDIFDTDLDVATLDNELHIVDFIVAHRGSFHRRTKMKFKVRWRGHTADHDTWEPYKNVKNLEALGQYMTANNYTFT